MLSIQHSQYYLKLINQIHLQLCILLSELGKNPEALLYSRKATDGTYLVFLQTFFWLLYAIYKEVPQQTATNPNPPTKPAKRQLAKTGQSNFIVRKG